MKSNNTFPIFWASEIILFCIVVLGMVIFLNARKPKTELLKAQGAITMLTKSYQSIDDQHDGKMRFINISGSKEVFEIFIGKESGDFSPEFEKIDDLKTGDTIIIYYMDPILSADEPVNRMTQFINKGSKPYFIKGNTDKLWGLGMMEFGGFLMGVIFILKYKRLIT